MLSVEDKKFIIKSVENGYKIRDLAKMFNVTPRRVQQILKEDLNSDRNKRKTDALTPEEMKEIENLWLNYKIGSRTIYYLLKSQGKNVSYYQIYNYMRNKSMIKAKDGLRQQDQEKLEEPLSTVYIDYHQTSTNSPYAVVFVDMVTKKILALTEARKITKEVLQELVDKVSAFTEETGLKVKKAHLRSGVLSILYGATDLRFYMRKKGIIDVEADKHGNRVHLALSRLWQNYDRFRWNFENVERFVEWYNNRPVINRVENRVTTPNEIMERFILGSHMPLSKN
ncbi:MAG TPA: IS481 family transposase [Thermoplasmataceae archaeon]|nr:IS481 family transposase [Thermoplasmatales archaeon AK]HLH85634.1 IS481 family transposase [Thermoplasmataceae archaeon]